MRSPAKYVSRNTPQLLQDLDRACDESLMLYENESAPERLKSVSIIPRFAWSVLIETMRDTHEKGL